MLKGASAEQRRSYGLHADATCGSFACLATSAATDADTAAAAPALGAGAAKPTDAATWIETLRTMGSLGISASDIEAVFTLLVRTQGLEPSTPVPTAPFRDTAEPLRPCARSPPSCRSQTSPSKTTALTARAARRSPTSTRSQQRRHC